MSGENKKFATLKPAINGAINYRALPNGANYTLALQARLHQLLDAKDSSNTRKSKQRDKLLKIALKEISPLGMVSFYKDLVNLILQERNLNSKKLQALYLELMEDGSNEELYKLHEYLGYARGAHTVHCEELANAIKNEDLEKVQELISKGHFITNLNFLSDEDDEDKIPILKTLLRFSNHPNIDLIAFEILSNLINRGMLNEFHAFFIGKEALLALSDTRGKTLLHFAAKQGNRELVKFLIEKGADANAKDENGYTPLHEAAFFNRPSAVEELILKKAKIDEACNVEVNGYTTLRIAIVMNHLNIVKILVKAGADVNKRSHTGGVPLHTATFALKCDDEIVKFLIAEGANVNASAGNGSTVLMNACIIGRRETVKILVQAGADVNTAHPENGQTALHCAAYRGHSECAKILLDNGANLYARGNEGETPLDCALRGYTNKRMPENQKVIDLLESKSSKLGYMLNVIKHPITSASHLKRDVKKILSDKDTMLILCIAIPVAIVCAIAYVAISRKIINSKLLIEPKMLKEALSPISASISANTPQITL